MGSLPFGYLVAKAKGVNIFEVGSKSPGATNVRRVLGNGPGNLVFVLDAFKGTLAALGPGVWLHHMIMTGKVDAEGVFPPVNWRWFFVPSIIGLSFALLGHSYSIFTKFRGGKGVATTAGGFLVLMPWVLVIAVTVWVLTFKLSRYVSLASILAALALPMAAFFSW